MSCTADVRADFCEVWVPTQVQTLTQRVAAKVAGLDPAQVRVHRHHGGARERGAPTL
jgi:isoquinoline 1-oxidoreductase beta subunit